MRSYNGPLVYHELSPRKHTKKLNGDRVWKVDVVRFFKYALQFQVEGRWFERVTERLGNEKAECVVPALSCAYAFISDSRFAKEYKECNQYEKGLLPSPCLPNVEPQQNEIYTEAHVVESSRVVLIATKNTISSKDLCFNYGKTDCLSSVQLEEGLEHSSIIK